MFSPTKSVHSTPQNSNITSRNRSKSIQNHDEQDSLDIPPFSPPSNSMSSVEYSPLPSKPMSNSKMNRQTKFQSRISQERNRQPFSPLNQSLMNQRRRKGSAGDRHVVEKDQNPRSVLKKRSSHSFTHDSPRPLKRRKGEDAKPASSSTSKSSTVQTIVIQTDQVKHDPVKERDECNSDSYQFHYPTDLVVPDKTFRSAYRQALKYGTHQNELRSSKCNQLSLTEVIIPSIFKEQMTVLRKQQGRARGRGASDDVIKTIEYGRCLLKDLESDCIEAVEAARIKRKEERCIQRQAKREYVWKEKRQKKLEAKRLEKEQIKKEKIAKKKNERAMRLNAREAKLKVRETRRKERKANFKKNKDLWKEYAHLMTELAKLEKEKEMWCNASSRLTSNESSSSSHDFGLEAALEEVQKATDDCKDIETIQNIVHSITASANQIHVALQDVTKLVEKSDSMRKELYAKFEKDHKFHGYLGANDPKALFRAMTLM